MSCPTQSFGEDGDGEEGKGGVEENSRTWSIYILKINFKTSHSKLQEHQNHKKFANCLQPFLWGHSSARTPWPLHLLNAFDKSHHYPAGSQHDYTLQIGCTVTSTFSSKMTELLTVHNQEDLTVLSHVHVMQKPPKRHLGLAAPLWLGKSDSGNLALPKVPLVLCVVSWKQGRTQNEGKTRLKTNAATQNTKSMKHVGVSPSPLEQRGAGT